MQAFGKQQVEQPARLVFHRDQVVLDAGLEESIGKDCRHRNDDADAVEYSAIEIPCASCCGFDPACCEAKMSIMPTTVPSKPSSGAIEPIEPSNVR